MKIFRVSFGSNIVGSHDCVTVLAENEADALEKGKPMLNTHKLIPNFLNKFGRYNAVENGGIDE